NGSTSGLIRTRTNALASAKSPAKTAAGHPPPVACSSSRRTCWSSLRRSRRCANGTARSHPALGLDGSGATTTRQRSATSSAPSMAVAREKKISNRDDAAVHPIQNDERRRLPSWVVEIEYEYRGTSVDESGNEPPVITQRVTVEVFA